MIVCVVNSLKGHCKGHEIHECMLSPAWIFCLL